MIKHYVIQGNSESGDLYLPKVYHHEPTEKDKRDYILKETHEKLDCGGPGHFGSYVYLTVSEA